MRKFSGLLLSALLATLALSCSTTKKTTPSMEMDERKGSFPRTDALLQNLLAGYPAYFDSLLQHEEQWRIQVIYSQVDRRADNQPVLTHFYFNVDPNRYFYPASTVKMPAAALALQRLNELNVPGLNKSTTLVTEADAPGQTAVYNDPSSPDGRPTIEHYIKKIFLVSDNDAYNRLYEFLGQEYLNQSLHRMGYDSVQLLHRLQLNLSEEQNRTTNPIKFYDTAGKLIYSQPLRRSGLIYTHRRDFLGTGYLANGKLVNQPFDFSVKNRISLPDLHSILQSLIFPGSVPDRQRFKLTGDDYAFMYRYMSMKPGESRYPQYDSTYPDAYVKFLLFGGNGPIENPSIRIFNKVGDAYGFLQDVAYVVDFKNGIEFLLSASILCNSNGIFNDDQYDYNNVGLPFLKHLGEVIYQYEKERKRKHKPDLSTFRFDH